MKKIRVGIVGTGFAANIHMRSYRRVYGVNVSVDAVCSRGEGAEVFAERYRVPTIKRDYKELISNPDIDVIDICVPPFLHHTIIEEALTAGKHVICEKPLTGYFGDYDTAIYGKDVTIGDIDKRKMYEYTMSRTQHLSEVIAKSGKMFFYAENWIYTPAITKAASLLKKKKDKILFVKGEKSHSGSKLWHAARWNQTGGGALIRGGVHPLSAAIWLKMKEAEASEVEFGITSVLGETGNVTKGLSKEELRFISARPFDVEDWGTALLTFADGTHASVFAGDFVVSGMRNLLEINTNTGTLLCNIASNYSMATCFATEQTPEDDETDDDEIRAWRYEALEDDFMFGYVHEIQDFMECIIHQRQPLSDFKLAAETVNAVYAAYLSAESGSRVTY